jgi:RNA polymerase sigma-70 factor (ECF subfamily)
MDAHERADAEAVIELLGDDVRFSMPPQDERYEGRAAVAGFLRTLFGDESPGEWRLVATRANGRPAVANYIRAWGEDEFRAVVLDVLRIEDGVLVEITSFTTDTFATFGLPAIWPPA